MKERKTNLWEVEYRTKIRNGTYGWVDTTIHIAADDVQYAIGSTLRRIDEDRYEAEIMEIKIAEEGIIVPGE